MLTVTELDTPLCTAARTSSDATLARLARRCPDLSPDERTVVRHLIGTRAKDARAAR